MSFFAAGLLLLRNPLAVTETVHARYRSFGITEQATEEDSEQAAGMLGKVFAG